MNSEKAKTLIGIVLCSLKEKYPSLRADKSKEYPAYAFNVHSDLKRDFVFLKVLDSLFSQLGLQGPFKIHLEENRVSYQWWKLDGGGNGKKDDFEQDLIPNQEAA